MKKRLTITIILSVLAFIGLFAAHFWINHQGQNVRMTETTLAGSYEAAKGLSVNTKVQIDYGKSCMAWHTTTMIDEKPVSESKMLQGEPIGEEYHRFALDALLTSGGTYIEDDSDLADGALDLQIPEKVLQDLATKIGPGETIKETVDLSAYISTIQLDYIIDSYDPNQNDVRELEVMQGEENLFRSYFTVDAPETYPVTVTAEKNGAGKVDEVHYICEVESSTSASAYVAEDCIYLAVNGYNYDGTFYPLHDSRYSGILQIPLHQTRQLQIREIKKLCDLPEAVFVENLSMSPDGKSLLLLTLEDGSACLSVFNKETMGLEQKINLEFTYRLYEDEITSVSVGDDYYAAITSGGEYTILQYADGNYTHFTNRKLDLTKLKDSHENLSLREAAFATDFDNNKAAVSALAYSTYDEAYEIIPSYYLQVCSQDNLLYYGLFDSSLAKELAGRQIFDYDIDMNFVH